MTQDLITTACRLIDAHVEGDTTLVQDVTLNALGLALQTSPFGLQKAFKKHLGISPREYANAKRTERLKAQLQTGASVADAAYASGYGSIRALYEQAEATLGMTPNSYKKRGEGLDLVYAFAQCRLDLVLLAATQQGVCFLAFGADRNALLADLNKEFHKAASLAEDQVLLQESLEDVLAYLDGKMPDPDLPLDIQASAFQRRVWRELWAIPPGQTATYSQLAQALGMARGQRAVARACASNNVSLIIPCHRCIRGDGGLGGYRWGISRKKLLLAWEDKLWGDGDFRLEADA